MWFLIAGTVLYQLGNILGRYMCCVEEAYGELDNVLGRYMCCVEVAYGDRDEDDKSRIPDAHGLSREDSSNRET